MKRLIALVLILVTLCSSASAALYHVTATVKCDDYNHVAKDWGFLLTVNGLPIPFSSDGGIFLDFDTDQLTCTADITARNKHLDFSIKQKTVTVQDQPIRVRIPVKVKKTHGQYAGNVAKWTVIFKITPVIE